MVKNTQGGISRGSMIFPSVLLISVLLACGQAGSQTVEREPVIGGPCEGCEGVFVGLPTTFAATARVAPEGEPGQPMVIRGTVFDPEGRAAPGVIVYAYQTNADGVYPIAEGSRGTEAFRHGRLRAWARTDEEGGYEFQTIRPGSYPNRENPEHVHMHVIEEGCCTYYISSVEFTDDPLLTAEDREQAIHGRGGNGLVTPRRNEEGVWIVTRDIHLGRGIPGYRRR